MIGEKKQISLNQKGEMLRQIKQSKNLGQHWDVETDHDKAWEIVGKLTEKQYKYFLALLINRKYLKLNGLLEQWGFLRKETKNETTNTNS